MDISLHQATQQVIDRVHAYMRVHSESELHTCGKMFGVLLVKDERVSGLEGERYLAAFSAKLDGSYHHEGFVPPVWEGLEDERIRGLVENPIGHSKEESRRLQKLLFANYNFVNGRGETKNLLEIFANEKPIVPAEEWFNKSKISNLKYQMPPSGAGECCAPKLLQYALTHGLKPLQLAEFWVGAPSKTEIRQEGAYYAPCSGRCVPILRHMTKGLENLKIEGLQEPKKEDLPKPEILYEDEWLMVVNKPAGLLSVPGKSDEPSVEDYFQCQMSDVKFIKAVHRLDQDTSGLLVLAKTPEVYKTLQAYFQRRDILKRYEAVCKGLGDERIRGLEDERIRGLEDEGIIELPLLPNPYDRPRQMVDREHGKVAITRYMVRERRADGTLLVDFYPLTGRTHQLRVHAAHPDGLNAPIVGDRLYSSNLSPLSSNRLMLHAAEIRFVHPVTQQEMHFCTNSAF